jgi:hypothetical protein
LLKANSILINTHYFCGLVYLVLVKRIVLILIAASVIFINGCGERAMVEIPETNESVENSLDVLSEVISTFDIIDDLASTQKLLFKKEDPFITSEVEVVFTDTSFSDGDGVSVELDFGPLGNTPQGVLCKDGKYRAGKFSLSLSKPYSENGAELVVHFSAGSPFYSGNGEVMTELRGDIVLDRKKQDEIECTTDNLKVIHNSELFDVEVLLSIFKESDYGIGLKNDILLFDGEVNLADNQSTTTLSTNAPLKKVYTLDCAKNVIAGDLSAEFSGTESEVSVEFDPFEDEACDNIVAITINGKTVIHAY